VDKIERRVLETFMIMSYTGRVSLINSLLTSIATFTTCSIELNPKILEHIEKIRRHCLWVNKIEEGEEIMSLIGFMGDGLQTKGQGWTRYSES
jgi:hypothetical protein